MHLIEYSRTAPWIRTSLEELICEQGISGIFSPFEVDIDATDIVQVGVYKAAREEQSRCKLAAVLTFVLLLLTNDLIEYLDRGKADSGPADLSTSVGLLSILDRKTSSAVKVILQEAQKLGEHKVAQLYESNGICVDQRF